MRTLVVLTLAVLLAAPPANAAQQQPRAAAAGFDGAATPVSRVDPEFPPMAKAAGISGEVVVSVLVSAAGGVTTAKALSGHPLLREAAVAAARQWTFEPAASDGKPVSSFGRITFDFELPEVSEEAGSEDDVIADEADSGADGDVAEEVDEPGDDPGRIGVADDDLGSDEEYDPVAEALGSVRANPTSAEAQFELAGAYMSVGRQDEAIAAYRTALSIRPDYEDAALALGDLYRNGGNVDAAVLVYQESLKSLPGSTALLNRLMAALWIAKRPREAVPYAERLVALEPSDANHHQDLGSLYMLVERYDDALSEMNRALALEPDSPRALHGLAATYLRMRRLDDAAVIYGRLRALKTPYSGLRQANREYGWLLVQAGRPAEAVDVLEIVIAESPDFYPAYCQLGQAYVAVGRAEDAVALLKRGAAEAPNEPCLPSSLGGAYTALGNKKEAERAFRTAVDLADDDPWAHANLAGAYLLRERFAEAREEVARAVTLAPKESRMRILEGQVLNALKDYRGAEAAYRKALELAPDNAMALNGLGYFLAVRGEKLEEAVTLLSRAVALDSKNGSLLDSLGWAYFKLGKLDEAEHYLVKAGELRPQSAEIAEHVGDLHERRGRAGPARDAWRRALALDPPSEQAARLKAKLAPAPPPAPPAAAPATP